MRIAPDAVRTSADADPMQIVLVVGDDICPHAVWAIEHAAALGRVALFFDRDEAASVGADLRPPLWSGEAKDPNELISDFERVVVELALERRAVLSETDGAVLFHAYGGPDVLAGVDAAEAACRAPRRRKLGPNARRRRAG